MQLPYFSRSGMKAKSLIYAFILGLFSLSFSHAQLQSEWANSIGSIHTDMANSIQPDGHGYVYVSGNFIDTVDFDPSSNVFNLVAVGPPGAFLAKYTVDGEFRWAVGADGDMPINQRDMAVDANGNVYVYGEFQGTAVFDQATNTVLASNGAHDLFLAKYDSSGNFQWAHNVGSFAPEWGYGITVDHSGDVYITGEFQLAVDFDPSSSSAIITNQGGPDAFVAKYNSLGDFVWVQRISGPAQNTGFQVTTDGTGHVYATGRFGNMIHFDTSSVATSALSLTASGAADTYIAKFNASNGDIVWAKSIGGEAGAGTIVTNSILASEGNLFLGGYFNTTMDFDLDTSSTASITSIGGRDVFIAKYDTAMNYVWAHGMGGTSNDELWSLDLDSMGGVHATGFFHGAGYFNPNSTEATINAEGNRDVFLVHLDANGEYQWSYGFGGTGDDEGKSIAFDELSGDFFLSGYYNNTVDFDPDTANTLDLTAANRNGFYAKYSIACYPMEDSAAVTICGGDSLEFGSQNIFAAGIYTEIFTSQGGCDSTVVMNVSVDSVSLTADSLEVAICAGDSVVFGSQTISSAGVYTEVYPSQGGCDSTIVMLVTVDSVSFSISRDTSVANQNYTFSAQASSDASFQWIDCNSGLEIASETNASFTPDSNGSYALVVTENGCSDTSECFVVADLQIEKLEANQLNVYPNPANNELFVDINTPQIARLMDLLGNTLSTTKLEAGTNRLDVSGLPSGVYLLNIANGTTVKVIINR